MILTIFIVLLSLSALCITLGLALRENYFTFVGLFFIFLLGVQLLSGNVEYRSGTVTVQNNSINTIYQYGSNYTSYHWDYDTGQPECNKDLYNCVNLFHTYTNESYVTEEIYNYTAFDKDSAFWYGFLLSFLGGIGMAIMLFQTNKDYEGYTEKLK